MKILQVNKLYYPWIGGMEKIVQHIAEGLNGKNKLEVEVLCCQSKGKNKEEVNGVRIHRASTLGICWGMPLSFDFFRLFREFSKNADIVDFHHPFPLGDLAIFLFPSRAKLVVHYHSDIVRQKTFSPVFKPLSLNTLNRAKKILVSNPNLVKNSPFLKKFNEKCEVIPFGVDLEEIERTLGEKQVGEIKEEYGDFVLFVGRLNYYKGVEYLIKAMRGINANLVIIGEGKQERELKREAKELGMADQVFFLPPQERKKLIDFYSSAKVFVLPSIFKSEAFGIVLIEAMACATPVISTELGTGTSFVNEDGVTGFVVPPRDPEVLAQAIKRILEDEKLTQDFSQKAKERVKKKFSLNKMLQETLAIYESV